MNFSLLNRDLKNLLLETIRSKLAHYRPETENMPFHYRLLGRDRYAMFSFIQSVNTTFGTSLWEQMALIIARAGDLSKAIRYISGGGRGAQRRT